MMEQLLSNCPPLQVYTQQTNKEISPTCHWESLTPPVKSEYQYASVTIMLLSSPDNNKV